MKMELKCRKTWLGLSFAMVAMTATAQNVSTIKQAGNIIPATDSNIQYVGRVSFRNQVCRYEQHSRARR